MNKAARQGKRFRALMGYESPRSCDEWALFDGEPYDPGCVDWTREDESGQAQIVGTVADRVASCPGIQYRRAIRTDGCPDGFRWADRGERTSPTWRSRAGQTPVVGATVVSLTRFWIVPIDQKEDEAGLL